MKIVMSGGTGFLGQALSDALAADGHDVVALTRQRAAGGQGTPRPHVTRVHWSPEQDSPELTSVVDGAGAVINLAGESIAGRRWTAAQKDRIRASRIAATRRLADAATRSAARPDVFVSGSAIGYYGSRGDETLTETSAPGDDYLADVCVQWETEAKKARAGRVALVRTGIVLERGGALAKMLPPFKAFVGGPLGSGRQHMSWIHRADWVELVRWILRSPGATGPINATAPNPVTNAEFSGALGRALERPSWLPAPAFALRLVLGEMADALLLGGQKVLPQRATDLGFRFRYPELDQALDAVLKPRR